MGADPILLLPIHLHSMQALKLNRLKADKYHLTETGADHKARGKEVGQLFLT